MSLTIPWRRERPRHRAVDKVAELREENRRLLTRQMAADDFFAILIADRQDVYAAWEFAEQRRQEAEQAAASLRSELDEALETVQRIDDHYNATIKQLERDLAESGRRLEVGVLAEAAAARTQEIPVISAVVPLPESPLTRVDAAELAAAKASTAGLLGPVADPGLASQVITPVRPLPEAETAPCAECPARVPAGTTYCSTRCRNAADDHNDLGDDS